jgi:hypothetical protein
VPWSGGDLMAINHDDCRGTESMTLSTLGPVFNDAPFHERFDRLRASCANHDNLIRELERTIPLVKVAPTPEPCSMSLFGTMSRH